MFRKILLAAALATASVSAASAQSDSGWYGSASLSWLDQDASRNSGVTTAAFQTGNGAPVIPAGTTIASGTAYGWNTEFDGGYGVSGEIGYRYGNGVRVGAELAYTQADIDRHSGVNVAGTVIDAVDAAVLTGSATQLGATVGAVVADGQGEITNTAIFLNAYYDFNRDAPLQPYVGAGIGLTKAEVVYRPSNVDIINDDDTVFAYQVKAGATWKLSGPFELFGEAVYRASEDIGTTNNLFPGSLDIENKQTLVSLGGRYRFGG
jgi:opacity protein-like surface antigen